MMRVAMYYNNRDVRLEEMPLPSIGPGELLLRVWASGICGSDLMEWYRIQRAPLVLGHEIAGEVVQVGEGVGDFRVGDRVFASHHVPCNACRYCLNGHPSVCDTLRETHFEPGGFAEYIRLPKINVDFGTFLLPSELSFEEGSFIEPLACVVRAHRSAPAQRKQTILVVGSGISGLLHVQLAKSRGIELVVATDINDYRLQMARALGADQTIHADDDTPVRLREMSEGRLADLVVVCTGAPAAVDQALKLVERGGTLLFFAPTASGVNVSIPLFDYWRDEITIKTSYAASPEDLKEAIALIRSRRIKVGEMITHRLGLAETGQGFHLTASGQQSLKVIIEPQRL